MLRHQQFYRGYLPRLAGLAVTGALVAGSVLPAQAQTAYRDGIGKLIEHGFETGSIEAAADGEAPGTVAPMDPAADPRAGDPDYERAKALMRAVDAILKDTAKHRSEANKLPSKDEFLVAPLWTETREDREEKVRDLLDAALGIVTDVPVVEVQKRIEALRRNIREIEDQIVILKERKLTAPDDSLLPGVLADTVDSLETEIQDSRKRIEANREEIAKAKRDVHTAMKQSGVQLESDQIDLLLDGVLSGDLVRLVAVFNAAKLVDGQLAKLMSASGDNIKAARKYFAMHAALFAMLVHAQDATIAKIDNGYMPKLDAILRDIRAASAKTRALLKETNRPDQRRALEANRESQKLAEEAAKGYRRYLQQQREQIARARARATHDLRIADNTFETVEASFQLRALMRDSAASFEAIQRLEAPTFDQIFRNDELRREFENLTRQLDIPTS